MPSDYTRKRRAAKITPRQQVSSVLKSIAGLDMPDPGRVWGIDTSTHVEGVPNWHVAALKGCRFADIKVINGMLEVPRWRESWAVAKDAGLPRIAYGWVYPSIPGRSAGGQARKFAGILKFDPPEIGYQADFEWTHGGDPTFRDLYGYVIPLEQETGKIPSIYTGWFWEEAEEGDWQGQPAYGRRHPFWERYPLHIAAYGTQNPRIPLPWHRATYHQWTEDGDGVALGFNRYDARKVDLNYYLGSDEEFHALLGTTPAPPPPDESSWFGGRVKVHKGKTASGTDYRLLTIRVADIADVVVDHRYNSASTTNWMNARPTLDLAINGPDQFSGGKLGGFAAYHGTGSLPSNNEETIYVDRFNRFSMVKPQELWTAFSVPNVLIRMGILQEVAYRDPTDIRARTALGFSRDGTELYILVADGGDYAARKGMSFLETAKTLQDAGAWLAVMGDGGGSTTLVKREGGRVQIVGKPSGENPPDADGKRQRSVAQHLGLRLKG